MERLSLKILHTNFHHGWGGQAHRILMVCQGLQQQGHQVFIAAPRNSELIKRAQAAKIKVFEKLRFARGFRPRLLIRDVLGLRRILKHHRFDILHLHGSQDSWTAFFSLFGIKAPDRPAVIRTRHNLFPIKDHFANRLLYGRFFTRLICISTAIYNDSNSKKYIGEHKLRLIYSATDMEKMDKAPRSTLPEELRIEKNFLIGTIGRLRPEKGHRFLLAAIPEVIKAIPEAQFLIVGDGSLADDILSQAQRMAISDHVSLTGFRRDVPGILKTLDLFVLPSITEGLGTAVIEAAACQAPIIASNIGGIKEIIPHKRAGLLVEPSNPQALAQAIIYLYNHPALRKRLATNAYKIVKQNFDKQRLVEETEAVYLDTLRDMGRLRKPLPTVT